MKYFLTILFLALSYSTVSAAPSATWDYAGTGHDGFRLYCEPTPIAGSPLTAQAADPALRAYDLDAIAGCIVQGVEVEVWLTAYNAANESAHSNHIRLTPPVPSQTITLPGQPSTFTIQWQ